MVDDQQVTKDTYQNLSIQNDNNSDDKCIILKQKKNKKQKNKIECICIYTYMWEIITIMKPFSVYAIQWIRC
jgi:hypothetical protein